MALKQLTAITEIHMTKTPGKAADPEKGTPAVRPEVTVVPAGAQFKAQSEKQQDELVGMGAARFSDEGEGADSSQAPGTPGNEIEPEIEPEAEAPKPRKKGKTSDSDADDLV